MGKCVSKQTTENSNWTGENASYLTISEKSFILLLNDDDKGQSESKKQAKRDGTRPETKGTAMSFGFKKKATGQTKKTGSIGGTGGNNNITNIKAKEKEKEKLTRELQYRNATVISNQAIIFNDSTILQDDNGNNKALGSTDSLDEVGGFQDGDCGFGRTTPRLTPPKKESSGIPYRSIRFGFRQSNVIRPASVGLQPKITTDYDTINDYDTITNNNVTVKRRSKSASNAPHPISAQNHYNNNNNNNNHKMQMQIKQSNLKINSPNRITTTTPTEQHQPNATANAMAPKQTNAFKVQTTNGSKNENEHEIKNKSVSYSSNLYTVINSENHTNVIVRPTPHQHQQQQNYQPVQSTVAVSKFTLHTTSLPKPQYPVPISLPSSSSSSLSSSQRYAMDTKIAKQAANNTTRKIGFYGPSREVSADSGISSVDGNYYITSSLQKHNYGRNVAAATTTTGRNRPRNLEMIFNGRHKFEVRDLDDSFSSDDSIVPLSLPKLPNVFSDVNNSNSSMIAPLSGLIRGIPPHASNNDEDEDNNNFTSNTESNENKRKFSLSSLNIEESIEEEKLSRDNSVTEKNSKTINCAKTIIQDSSKTSSTASSRASWYNNAAGESMAFKDCSSISLSSSDSIRNNDDPPDAQQQVADEEDISSVTLITDDKSILSSFTMSLQQNQLACKPLVVQKQFNTKSHNLLKNLQTSKEEQTNEGNAMKNTYELNNIEESKFAELTATVNESALLDDETLPNDSLVSSSSSGSSNSNSRSNSSSSISDNVASDGDIDEIISKQNKKKINDSIKEKENIDEISPILELCSPMSPGTPTHASNSFSLSDAGRDFLIDDEIADQPALCFNDKQQECSTNQQLFSQTETTPTIVESLSSLHSNKFRSTPLINNNNNNSNLSNIINNNISNNCNNINSHNNSYAPKIKPRQSILSRTESLDTLSPCESIASDDLMLDFECHSSIDSLDRMSRSNHSESVSALHSINDTQLWSELEAQDDDVIKEWSTLLRASRQNINKDTIVSQLPARATRLLNRTRLQQQQISSIGVNNNQGIIGTGDGNFAVSRSDSPRSLDSFHTKSTTRIIAPTSRLSPNLTPNTNSPDASNVFLYDKTLRNSMIQDMLYFKKQLIRLRSILQEENIEECLMMTDTLNPFDLNNGQFFNSCTGGGGDSKLYLDNLSDLDNYSSIGELNDPKQELMDLRRQVVFLQSQIDDKDRTIKQQKNLIDKLELDINKMTQTGVLITNPVQNVETINIATQTERRPLSIGPDGIARNDVEEEIDNMPKPKLSRQHKITSSNSSSSKKSSPSTSPIHSQRSSTTTTNGNHIKIEMGKIGSQNTVRSTQIGNALKSKSLRYQTKSPTSTTTIISTPTKQQPFSSKSSTSVTTTATVVVNCNNTTKDDNNNINKLTIKNQQLLPQQQSPSPRRIPRLVKMTKINLNSSNSSSNSNNSNNSISNIIFSNNNINNNNNNNNSNCLSSSPASKILLKQNNENTCINNNNNNNCNDNNIVNITNNLIKTSSNNNDNDILVELENNSDFVNNKLVYDDIKVTPASRNGHRQLFNKVLKSSIFNVPVKSEDEF